jgi:DNA/RNA endonuclease YhcR with UshA esterase domain
MMGPTMTIESERLRVTHSHSSRLRAGAAGLVLAGLAAFAACDAAPAPPFAFTATGEVEGLVFFDVLEDGIFDPAGGDVAIAGVTVSAQGRGTGETFAGGTAQSGADGRFQIAGLPLGTHDLLIDTTTVPAGVAICQNPIRFSITANAVRFQSVQGRAGCLITIQEAKELALGEFVIVRGIVTGTPGQVDASRVYIQDATAGALIFSSALDAAGLALGDQVEISAVTGQFGNEFEFLNPVTLRELVAGVGVVDPVVVTTQEIADAGPDYTDPIQGRLVRLEAAQLTGAFGSTGNEQNAPIDDGSGGITIRVDDGVAVRAQLNTLFTVGSCYNLNGFVANFNGAGQFFLRSMADVEEVSCN